MEHPKLLVLNIPLSVERLYAKIFITRRSGRYAPILLAPAEGWGALWAPRALRALLGAFGPSSVAEGVKEDILNLVSKLVLRSK